MSPGFCERSAGGGLPHLRHPGGDKTGRSAGAFQSTQLESLGRSARAFEPLVHWPWPNFRAVVPRRQLGETRQAAKGEPRRTRDGERVAEDDARKLAMRRSRFCAIASSRPCRPRHPRVSGRSVIAGDQSRSRRMKLSLVWPVDRARNDRRHAQTWAGKRKPLKCLRKPELGGYKELNPLVSRGEGSLQPAASTRPRS